MRDDKILNRIRALLAKAESTTPEEAELLTAKAAELMLRHEISQSQVAADHAVAEGFKEFRFEFQGVYMRQFRRLVGRVASALGGLPGVLDSLQVADRGGLRVGVHSGACRGDSPVHRVAGPYGPRGVVEEGALDV